MTEPEERDTAESAKTENSPSKGVIAWFVEHPVAANLLMLVLMLGGLLSIPRIGKEVFPRAQLDLVTVTIPYPGASPAQVEQGVVRAIEEEVRSLEGVKEVSSLSAEGRGIVTVELLLGSNRNEMLNEVESAVNRITSFPEGAEEPTVSLVSNRRQVVSLVYHGELPRETLREWAEQGRERLLDDPKISFVQLAGKRPREIAIELDQEALRRHELSIGDVASRVRSASRDLPAGELETAGGEIALRTTGREESAAAFRDMPIVVGEDGSQVLLRDLGQVKMGFRDVDRATFFDGQPAMRVDVYRIGSEGPLEVSRATKAFAEQERQRAPPGLSVSVWNDQSQIYEDRMSLLMENAYLGLSLVLLILGLFLAPRLAFWVTLGIPISFLGALLFLPAVDVTINLISLFAFIVALGLVVDDAIVVGEAIFWRRQRGDSLKDAAIGGAQEVARPVLFSIATTSIAFTPMLFVPGVAGQFFRNIPLVVLLALGASLLESLLVLPTHLAHRMPKLLALVLTPLLWVMKKLRSDKVSAGLDRFVSNHYTRLVRSAVRWRYVTLGSALLLLLMVVGLQAGGRINFRFLPDIEDDQISANLELPVGTPFERTSKAQRRLVAAAEKVAADLDSDALEGVYSEVGQLRVRAENTAAVPRDGSHVTSVIVDLVAAGQRDFSSSDFVERWRRELGQLEHAGRLEFSYTTGASEGAPINIQLSHPNIDTLEHAARELASQLEEYENVVDVDDGVTSGKARIDFELSDEGRAHGITEAALARELRGAFFGAEVQRFQLGRDETRVYVRLDESGRDSLSDLYDLVIRTPGGGTMPLRSAATLEWDRAFTRIERTEMQRTANVTAHVRGDLTAGEVSAHLQGHGLKELKEKYPRLSSGAGGQQESQAEAMTSLATGFLLALVVMVGLLAVAFQSYVQPFIVLAAIPFGIIGAVLGHLALGYNLSLSSMFGLVALSGVVVNDSLLMVDAINHRRPSAEDIDRESLTDAVVEGAARRFRPVLMTSLTTFGGLSPMIFESGVQAQFLVPMAISLGFGILFATFVLVLLVPSLYLIVEDLKKVSSRAGHALLPERTVEEQA